MGTDPLLKSWSKLQSMSMEEYRKSIQHMKDNLSLLQEPELPESPHDSCARRGTLDAIVEQAKKPEEVKYGVHMNPMPPPGYALVKRYLLLSGDRYYPGAWEDFKGTFDSMKECMKEAHRIIDTADWGLWYQVIDLDTMTVIREGESEYP